MKLDSVVEYPDSTDWSGWSEYVESMVVKSRRDMPAPIDSTAGPEEISQYLSELRNYLCSWHAVFESIREAMDNAADHCSTPTMLNELEAYKSELAEIETEINNFRTVLDRFVSGRASIGGVMIDDVIG